MSTIQQRLDHWPRNLDNEVIFKSSEQAIFYATLIFDKQPLIAEIKKVRTRALSDIGQRRNNKGANLDMLTRIACKGQFARECLEECERPKNDTHQLNRRDE